jgi:hypothetical protein
MKQINEAFSQEESSKIYDNFLAIVNDKKRRDRLVSKHGKNAEAVAYGTAVNQVKKQAANKIAEPTTEEPMEDNKLKEMVKAALSKPLDEKKKSFPDLTGDGKVTKADVLKARGVDLDEGYDEFDMEDEGPDYNNISDLEDELRRLIRWSNQYGSSGADAKIEQLKKRIEQLKNTNKPLDETNLGHGEISSITPEGGSWIVSYRTMDGKKEKVFQSEDEARKFASTLNEDLDLGHQDDEPHMIKAELAHIAKYAIELYKMVDQFEGPQEVDFPAWWQSKITTARNMISSAKHYLEFELEEPKIDAMVDVASEEGALDEKLTPSMGVDSYIKDFTKSKDPKFKGESKKERIKRAVAAFYQAKK